MVLTTNAADRSSTTPFRLTVASPPNRATPAAHHRRRPPAIAADTGSAPSTLVVAALPLATLLLATLLLAVVGVLLGAPIASAVVVVGLVPAACVDLRSGRLPDPLVLAAGGAGLTAALAERLTASPTAAQIGAASDTSATAVLLGVAAAAGPLLVLHLASPASLGFGDVKAAAVLGAGVALVDPLAGLVTVAAAGAIGTVAGISFGRRTIPFGPPLVVGAATALVVTPWIVGR